MGPEKKRRFFVLHYEDEGSKILRMSYMIHPLVFQPLPTRVISKLVFLAVSREGPSLLTAPMEKSLGWFSSSLSPKRVETIIFMKPMAKSMSTPEMRPKGAML